MIKRILAISLLFILLPLSSASAAPNPHYGTFGNLKYGDCMYEAMANLELHEFPTADITVKEVLAAWRGNSKINVMQYMIGTGYDGYTVNHITHITTRAGLIYAANHGGAWTTMFFGSHAAAIIHASSRGVTIVDDGIIEHFTWRQYTLQTGRPLWVWGITWNSTQVTTTTMPTTTTTGAS